MILPGVLVPEPFRPYGLVLPDGYDVRQDREAVYLVFGSEDLVASWDWRDEKSFELTSKIVDAAEAHVWGKRQKEIEVRYGEGDA